MSEIIPTEEQAAVAGAIAQAQNESASSVLVDAGAGCAKTTTWKMGARRVGSMGLVCSFNKKIADDAKLGLGENWTVKTLNGLGHGAWAGVVDGGLKLDDRKLGTLVTEISKAEKVRLDKDQWSQVRGMVSGAMQLGLVPGDEGAPLVPDTLDTWMQLADAEDVEDGDISLCVNIAQMVLREDIRLAKAGVISFDDQVYCPTVLGGKWRRYPIVIVDEAQDLSPLNHAMLRQMMGTSTRLIVLGDPSQSIYSFRGAGPDSMSKMQLLRQQWVQKPLTMTFRCPKVVVARQQLHKPGFRAWDGCADGDVQHWDGWEHTQLLALPGPTAVLCRNNAPLVSLAFKLIRRQIGVQMLGRDIGKGLIALSKKLMKDDGMPAIACAHAVTEWVDREAGLVIANKQDSKLDGIYDRAECLRAVLGGTECRSAGQLRTMLGQLFESKTGLITLSTIHKAKGLEFNSVLHLDPKRVPSRWAKSDADLQQEANMLYVLETRTRNVLAHADLELFGVREDSNATS